MSLDFTYAQMWRFCHWIWHVHCYYDWIQHYHCLYYWKHVPCSRHYVWSFSVHFIEHSIALSFSVRIIWITHFQCSCHSISHVQSSLQWLWNVAVYIITCDIASVHTTEYNICIVNFMYDICKLHWTELSFFFSFKLWIMPMSGTYGIVCCVFTVQ